MHGQTLPASYSVSNESTVSDQVDYVTIAFIMTMCLGILENSGIFFLFLLVARRIRQNMASLISVRVHYCRNLLHCDSCLLFSKVISQLLGGRCQTVEEIKVNAKILLKAIPIKRFHILNGTLV